jgi:phosphoglycolate phosphatase-like HAD superfamily hydrolase
MIEQAARVHGIDPARSLMIGDKLSDVAAGRAAGCTTALLGSAKDAGTTELTPAATPHHRGADWPALLSILETTWKT